MTYSIKNTRNIEVDTVADNTLKTTSFGIQIPGKNFAGYGEAVGQSLLHILENFACPNNGSNFPSPTNSGVNLSNPAVGQLWYDTTNEKLRIWTGTAWVVSSGAATSSTTPPGAPIEGDLWWNSTTKQLFAWDGTKWVLIGPISDQTDLVFTRAIKINSGGTGGAGSGDASAPSGGTNTDALGMFVNNNLIGVWANASVASPTYYYIELNDGSNNVRYYSFSSYDGLIEIGLNIESGVNDYFNGKVKFADAAGSVSGIDSANFMRNDNGAGALNSRLPTTTSLDIGGSTSRWNAMYAIVFDGIATSAQYADLAERYETDSPVEEGDIVKLGGTKEITKTLTEMDDNVFGVVSTKPGFRLNESAGSDETHPFIALSGRIPVKVIGKVRKGQRLVSSSTSGVAMAVENWEITNSFVVIGRALEDKVTDEIGLVEAVVGAK